MRVRALKSSKNLDVLLIIAIGYIGLAVEKSEEKTIVIQLIEQSKRIHKAKKIYILCHCRWLICRAF